MKKELFFLILVLLFNQSKADIKDLFSELKQANCDTAKISVFSKISIEFRKSDMVKSAEYAKKAYDLSVESKDTTQIISTSLHLGHHYSVAGEQKKALKILYYGLEYATKKGDKDLQVMFYNNIGNCFGMFGDFKSALKYYLSSYEIAKESNKQLQISRVQNNIGQAYHELDSIHLALERYFIALEINKTKNFQEGLLYNYSNIGNSYLSLGDYNKASMYFRKHIKLAKEMDNKIHILWAHEYLSKLFLKKELYAISIFHADSAEQISKQINNDEVLLELYESRSQSYFYSGKYKQAYLDLFHLKSIADSINSIEKFNIAEEVKLQQNFTKQVEMLQLEKENTKLHDRKNKFNVIMLTLIILALLLISALIYLNNRNKIKSSLFQQKLLEKENESIQLENQKIELELDRKNKELTSNVLHLSNLNEFINSISSKLEEEKKNFKPENLKTINRIIKNIQSNTDDSIWKEFELRFEQVHSGFYTNIQKDYPSLTPNEKKLCAFLKLNMTSKDISSITGQSVHSIEVARTRLRKKLNLSNKDQSLIDFLDQY